MKQKPESLSHIDVSLRKVFDLCRQLPELKYLVDNFVEPLERGHDPHGICLDFVSYTQAMDEAQEVYFQSSLKMREIFQVHHPLGGLTASGLPSSAMGSSHYLTP